MTSAFNSINIGLFRTKKILLTSIISSLFLLTSCFDYEEVKFKGIEKLELAGQEEHKIKLNLLMRIENLNKFNIIIKKTDLDIYLNDNYLGKTTTDQKIKILKKKEAVYPVSISLKGKDVLKNTLGSLSKILGGPMKLGIKGKVTGKIYGISKTIDVDFSENVKLGDLLKGTSIK